MSSLIRAAFFALGVSLLAGCTAAPEADDVDATRQAATAEATVTFKADWTTDVSGGLERGKRLRIVYAPSRTKCVATSGGNAVWSSTAFYRWNGGPVKSTFAAGHNPDGSGAAPGIALDQTGQLEMWFQSNNIYGCNEYDSAYGQNYKFNVGAAATDPGWIGNASYAFERETCNGAICAGRWHPLDGGFVYETWARQRAALRRAGFEVWKAGVTDFDNPNLWQQLDVQVHRRYVGEAAFTTEYVSFDGRWGNNAHYGIDLRALDPFEWPRGANIRTAADCPKFTITRVNGGAYAEAQLEFYFTVNGVALRAGNGSNFVGKYQDYLGNFAVCAP